MLTYIRTYTGQKVDLNNPSPKSIMIADIARALSHICRFGGHTPEFYSVAQHSIYVAQMVPPDLQLAALLHDATEAYLGDMVSPLKALLPSYQGMERRFADVIGYRFDVQLIVLDPEIKRADLEMLVWEADALLGIDAAAEWGLPKPRHELRPQKLSAWPSKVAEAHFMSMFYRLTGQRFRAMEYFNGIIPAVY